MSTSTRGQDSDLVFCRYITHYRTGKRIYPKNGEFFVFPRSRGRRRQGPEQMELPLSDQKKHQQ